MILQLIFGSWTFIGGTITGVKSALIFPTKRLQRKLPTWQPECCCSASSATNGHLFELATRVALIDQCRRAMTTDQTIAHSVDAHTHNNSSSGA